MRQLTVSQKKKLLVNLKNFRKKYLLGKYVNLDESATRIVVNEFLSNVLGFASLDEIKTEYMIRGTYADYIVQIKGKRYFIVEVKSMSIELNEKHLRQAVNYAANEGIDWALLTNGRVFNFYRILFKKPIDSRLLFSIDLSDPNKLSMAKEHIQYLTKTLIEHRGLETLWTKVSALDPCNLAKFLYAKKILNYLSRELRRTYRNRFSSEEIINALTRIIVDKVDLPNFKKTKKVHKRHNKKTLNSAIVVSAENSNTTTG